MGTSEMAKENSYPENEELPTSAVISLENNGAEVGGSSVTQPAESVQEAATTGNRIIFSDRATSAVDETPEKVGVSGATQVADISQEAATAAGNFSFFSSLPF